MVAFDADTVLTGSADGLIRIIGILPNAMLGLVGEHAHAQVRLSGVFEGWVVHHWSICSPVCALLICACSSVLQAVQHLCAGPSRAPGALGRPLASGERRARQHAAPLGPGHPARG